MNEYVIELMEGSYVVGIGGIYILYNKKTKEVIGTHFSSDDAWALNDLLPLVEEDGPVNYILYGARYYGL